MFGLNGRPADADVVGRMSGALQHRGPDDAGQHVDGAVGLGFRRLSILDLSAAGHQPMLSPDRRHALVFNGEIYNFVEVRQELEQHGRRFRSTGDTEVLLQAYDQWGLQCVDRFNGMWAFALFDRERQTLVVSRDRFGVKPLFLHRSGDCILFASEIKAILASGLYTGGTNWEVASRFLLRGDLDVDNQSFYRDIERIGAGTISEFSVDGTLTSRRFWSLENIPKTDVADPATAFRDTFSDAVRLRMRSDVPIGVFLSGGLDSTSIICMMAAERERRGKTDSPLQAFSYMSGEFDESSYIRETVALTGADFEEVHIDPERLWEELDRVLWYHDEPVHSPTALVGFELMRQARAKGTTVILNGQGSDETLAGYWNYVYSYWTELVLAGHPARAWREMSTYCQYHPRKRSDAVRTVLKGAARSVLRRSLPAWCVPDRAASNGADLAWCSADLTEHLRRRPEFHEDGLRSALASSIGFKPLPLFLRIEDRNSMAHSVEARLPFMDYRLVELAFGLPSNWKVRAPWNKFILREAMRSVIPESIRTRLDKMGFPTSSRRWIASAWYEPMQDLFSSQSFRERGVFNAPALRAALDRHRSGGDLSAPLFAAAEFELWCRRRPGDAVLAKSGAQAA